jgi:hypothetical protein
VQPTSPSGLPVADCLLADSAFLSSRWRFNSANFAFFARISSRRCCIVDSMAETSSGGCWAECMECVYCVSALMVEGLDWLVTLDLVSSPPHLSPEYGKCKVNKGRRVVVAQRRAKRWFRDEGTSSQPAMPTKSCARSNLNFHSSTPNNPHPPRRPRHDPPDPIQRCNIHRSSGIPAIGHIRARYRLSQALARPSPCPLPSVSTYAMPLEALAKVSHAAVWDWC